jgi:hypothetical protein
MDEMSSPLQPLANTLRQVVVHEGKDKMTSLLKPLADSLA